MYLEAIEIKSASKWALLQLDVSCRAEPPASCHPHFVPQERPGGRGFRQADTPPPTRLPTPGTCNVLQDMGSWSGSHLPQAKGSVMWPDCHYYVPHLTSRCPSHLRMPRLTSRSPV
ncbi:hypothetical protein H1C71_036224 [Ictidomys tridecemlineatus]|nr:hypothetical protein H1C71_036224 [Ictidomys tridecemlineatus]